MIEYAKHDVSLVPERKGRYPRHISLRTYVWWTTGSNVRHLTISLTVRLHGCYRRNRRKQETKHLGIVAFPAENASLFKTGCDQRTAQILFAQHPANSFRD